MKKLISVIAPMYNEEQVIEKYCKVTLGVLRDLKDKYDYEIILVNDGSKDSTLSRMRKIKVDNEQEISIINLTRNFGLEGAVYAGLTRAIGDIIVTMDADLQDPPSLIPKLIDEYEKGVDIVTARRVKREHDSFFKRASAALFYKLFEAFSGRVVLERNASFYRLFSRKVLVRLLEMKESNPIFRVILPFIGMRNVVVDYERDKRFAGKTKYNISSLMKYALDSLTSISIEPLRRIAWCIPILTIAFIVFFACSFFTMEILQLACIILTVITFISILNMVCLSVIAEYIAQIMIESKHRPISIIYEYVPSGNSLVRIDRYEGDNE
jgi:dolichol-phosphate mannosyltransferase